jgi:hypothetical protein
VPPSYSHRDLRAVRATGRLVGVTTAGALPLAAAAYLLPESWIGPVAVVGLGVLGLVAVQRGSALVQGYEQDLRRAVGDGDQRDGWLRAESGARRGSNGAALPTAVKSPHVRSPRRFGPVVTPAPEPGRPRVPA